MAALWGKKKAQEVGRVNGVVDLYCINLARLNYTPQNGLSCKQDKLDEHANSANVHQNRNMLRRRIHAGV